MSDQKAAKTLAERQRHQLVEVPARAGEDLLGHMLRACSVNLVLLFGDLLSDARDRREAEGG